MFIIVRYRGDQTLYVNPNCVLKLIYEYLRDASGVPDKCRFEWSNGEIDLVDEGGNFSKIYDLDVSVNGLELLVTRRTYYLCIFDRDSVGQLVNARLQVFRSPHLSHFLLNQIDFQQRASRPSPGKKRSTLTRLRKKSGKPSTKSDTSKSSGALKSKAPTKKAASQKGIAPQETVESGKAKQASAFHWTGHRIEMESWASPTPERFLEEDEFDQSEGTTAETGVIEESAESASYINQIANEALPSGQVTDISNSDETKESDNAENLEKAIVPSDKDIVVALEEIDVASGFDGPELTGFSGLQSIGSETLTADNKTELIESESILRQSTDLSDLKKKGKVNFDVYAMHGIEKDSKVDCLQVWSAEKDLAQSEPPVAAKKGKMVSFERSSYKKPGLVPSSGKQSQIRPKMGKMKLKRSTCGTTSKTNASIKGRKTYKETGAGNFAVNDEFECNNETEGRTIWWKQVKFMNDATESGTDFDEDLQNKPIEIIRRFPKRKQSKKKVCQTGRRLRNM